MPFVFSLMAERIPFRNWSVSAFKHIQHFFKNKWPTSGFPAGSMGPKASGFIYVSVIEGGTMLVSRESARM